VATGKNTQFGKIAGLIEESETATPLQKRVAYLGKIISIIAFVIAGIVFISGFARGQEVAPLLTFCIAILVAAVPEGLPTAITLSLAVGATRMAKYKAIIRKMSVIETLGTVDIIATDKTGTLTNNKLTVDQVVLYKNDEFEQFDVTKPLDNTDALSQIFSCGIACSNLNANSKDFHASII
jgi:Ca2+-transporting ATPase